MNRILPLIGALLMAVSAGCLDATDPAPEGNPIPTTTDSVPTGTHGTGIDKPATPPQALRLLDCQSFVASVIIPLDALPREGTEEVPPEWRPSGLLNYAPAVQVQTCEKFEWGNFARGPITLVFDMHNAIDLPAACVEEFAIRLDRFISKIVLDDQEVAEALASASVPAFYAPIEQETTAGGAVEVITFRWPDPHSDVELTFAADAGSTGASHSANRMYAWFDKTLGQPGYLLLDYPTEGQWESSPVAQAVIGTNYYLGQQVAAPSNFSYTETTYVFDHTGSLILDRDLQCQD